MSGEASRSGQPVCAENEVTTFPPDDNRSASPGVAELEDKEAQATRRLSSPPIQDAPSWGSSSRRVSNRTESLIQEAARSVISQLEEARKSQDSLPSGAGVASRGSHDNTMLDSPKSIGNSRPQSRVSHASQRSHPSNPESAPDSLSQHGSDVFTEHSSLSSSGSSSSSAHQGHQDASFDDDDDVKRPARYASSAPGDNETLTHKTSRTPRISNISAYDEDFIPNEPRRNPRAVFARNGDFKYMPSMSSPEPSIYNGSTPKGSLRRRLGGSANVQYSPRSKGTPSRLKPRHRDNSRPLVLLHVTLLPLRWQWSDLVNSVDVAEMTEECKNLRDCWRLLQDNVGDTMLERGILLPHPQDDYETLEERLLDSLELPGKRRVRILECGHYAGNTLLKASDGDLSDDEDETEAGEDEEKEKRRWCQVCRCDMRYDSPGCAKIFRMKVFASNGLISAGAWEACWKEMERVDIELEPIVDPSIQDELENLAITREERRQAQALEADQSSYLHHVVAEAENEMVQEHLINEPMAEHPSLLSSPVPPMSSPGLAPSPTPNTRRRLDEERLREIYGRTPPASAQEHNSTFDSPTPSPCPAPRSEKLERDLHLEFSPGSGSHPIESNTGATVPETLERHPDSFIPASLPPSPTTQAFERRELRQAQQHQEHAPTRKTTVSKDASLAELLLQAARVAIHDKRNLVILFLSLLVLALALRAPNGPNMAESDPSQRIFSKTESPSVQIDGNDMSAVNIGKRPEIEDNHVQNGPATGMPAANNEPVAESPRGELAGASPNEPLVEAQNLFLDSAPFSRAGHELPQVADDNRGLSGAGRPTTVTTTVTLACDASAATMAAFNQPITPAKHIDIWNHDEPGPHRELPGRSSFAEDTPLELEAYPYIWGPSDSTRIVEATVTSTQIAVETVVETVRVSETEHHTVTETVRVTVSEPSVPKETNMEGPGCGETQSDPRSDVEIIEVADSNPSSDAPDVAVSCDEHDTSTQEPIVQTGTVAPLDCSESVVNESDKEEATATAAPSSQDCGSTVSSEPNVVSPSTSTSVSKPGAGHTVKCADDQIVGAEAAPPQDEDTSVVPTPSVDVEAARDASEHSTPPRGCP